MSFQRENAVSEALRRVGEGVVPKASPDLDAARKQRFAGAIDDKVDRLNRSGVLRPGRSFWAGLAAAVVLASGVAFALSRLPQVEESARVLAVSGKVSVTSSAAPAISAGAVLDRSQQLRTGRGARVELALVSKTQIVVDELALISVGRGEQGSDSLVERVVLSLGRANFSVPKLAPGRRLIVETPDATVTVRGTRFSVSVEARSGAALATRVSVSEGRVEVLSAGRSALLVSGSEWISTALETSAASVAPRLLPETAASTARSASGGVRPGTGEAEPAARSRRAEGAAVVASDLALQNRIFSSALQHIRAGNSARALADLEELIEKHPRSPLIQAVRVEHFRLLHQTGSTAAAAREARAYLSAFPAGFARVEAKRLALSDVSGSP